MLQGVWKQHLRQRVVVGYSIKIFLPSPPNYVTTTLMQLLDYLPTYTYRIGAEGEKSFQYKHQEFQFPLLDAAHFGAL